MKYLDQLVSIMHGMATTIAMTFSTLKSANGMVEIVVKKIQLLDGTTIVRYVNVWRSKNAMTKLTTGLLVGIS